MMEWYSIHGWASKRMYPGKFGRGVYYSSRGGCRYHAVNNNRRQNARWPKKKNFESPNSNKHKRMRKNTGALIEAIKVAFQNAFSHGRRSSAGLLTVGNSCSTTGFICERDSLRCWANCCIWRRAWRWHWPGSCIKLGLQPMFNDMTLDT